ncbi:MAG: HAD-IIIA family hydrolase [Rhodospirillales bacterium]
MDRDGVLSETDVRGGKPYAPMRFEDFHLTDEARPALDRLKEEGFLLVVVTNQPDVGNGLVAREIVERMNDNLATLLPVDAIKTCFHAQTDGCLCRKPNPGMLTDSAEELNIDLCASFMIGDRRSDVDAGARAGCTTIFIDREYGEPPPTHPDFTVISLREAVDIVLSHCEATDKLKRTSR